MNLYFGSASIFLSLALIHAVSGRAREVDLENWTPEEHWPAGEVNCTYGQREFNELTQKRVYTVGVHAPSGADKVWREFNLTFVTYLNEVVGKRWDPPIEFKMKPSENPLVSWIDEGDDVDFMYSDTGLYSCIGTEIGSQPIGTTIANLKARGREYELDMHGGTILVRADNEEINTIADLKDKVIAAQSLSVFAAAQSQFWVMYKNGLDSVMDPKQVIFTQHDDETVQGVLTGRWDVGFVPSGRAERTIDDATGEFIDPNLFKVIEPKLYIMDDGDIFPFLHSTPIFPEWPLFAKQNIDLIVSEEVALALINFRRHKSVGEEIHRCLEDAISGEEIEICNTMPIVYFDPAARCDTTRELAELAYQAGEAGHHSGFRPARSHFSVRTMQQDAGFIKKNKKGDWHCERSASKYEGITCPAGHYKVSKALFEHQCDDAGLPCPEGYLCYCRPCIEAYEMDIFPWDMETQGEVPEDHPRCDKMSLCGTLEQTKEVAFHAYDNLERINATVTALMYFGQESKYLPVTRILGERFYEYEFSYSNNMIGVSILEVYIDGVQIPESPFRVEVTELECARQRMFPNEVGVCHCSGDSIEIFDQCVSPGVFAAVVSSICIAIAAQILWWYAGYRRRKSDSLWQVSTEELHFGHPVEVIGQGAFGVVILAEYRGTKVAIKRVLPVKNKKTGSVVSFSKDESLQLEDENGKQDIEGGIGLSSMTRDSMNMISGDSKASTNQLNFLGRMSFGGVEQTRLQRWLPFMRNEASARFNSTILGTVSGSSTHRTVFATMFPCCDETARRQEEFKEEMRLLSRLRHPCITTVMGAVMNGYEPMMVMEYMGNGSLYDLLRNETLYTGGEIIMQIVRDVAQGLRFLHASKPPIFHGDLKAKNILIDSRFRAKVCDFGLATKSRSGLSGTPYWMAPEYLRRKSVYNSACDIYSFGIIMYEIYSRKDPYDGENPRRVLSKVCDPRINHRPPVPRTCPKKMAELMRKCWSGDPLFRPESKDLDLTFGNMNVNDAEPILEEGNTRLRKEVAMGDMMYQVFPRKVADMLKAGQKVEPETHDNVTVFFSDIIRFTDISRALSPVKVCNMLDRLYVAFDALAGKHEVFKVETIGDAWMGVTNLEGNQNDSHAKRIAAFAVDAVEAAGKVVIDEDDPSAGYLHIRVGFHSGQVVSNVIGSLNPRYGLFGDTVNTASRMESLSISGRIQCSDAAAKILKAQAPDFPLRKRGKVAVKGKGNMATYWVGEDLLNNSVQEIFDQKPVVGFHEEHAPSNLEPNLQPHSGKEPSVLRPRSPTRVLMDGSLEPPAFSRKTNRSKSTTQKPQVYGAHEMHEYGRIAFPLAEGGPEQTLDEEKSFCSM